MVIFLGLSVITLGLPAASTAVTRMEPVRDVALVLAVKLQVMVPESVPVVLDVISNQVLPDVTWDTHFMVPVPVFDTANVVDSAALFTSRLPGATDSTGVPLSAWITVTSVGLLVAPVAVTRITPDRVAVLVFAV